MGSGTSVQHNSAILRVESIPTLRSDLSTRILVRPKEFLPEYDGGVPVECYDSPQLTPRSPARHFSRSRSGKVKARMGKYFMQVGYRAKRGKRVVPVSCDGVEPHTAIVLVIYAGGTIGMARTALGYAPVRGYLPKRMQQLPQFQDPDAPPCTTPTDIEGNRVHYVVIEYDPLLDSSCMNMQDWCSIAKDIVAHHEDYDGFVVLHGTDTMAYTASALSFILDGLEKPVILTGSQVPLSELRNDAVENLLGALLIAGNYEIPEVCVYFRSKLMRGNRSHKQSGCSFDGFSSPNFKPLATTNVNIEVAWENILPEPKNVSKLTAHTDLCDAISVVVLFPGIRPQQIEAMLAPPMRGAILNTYGAGNAPEEEDFLKVIGEASSRGVVIVNVTQCEYGLVCMATYAAGAGLAAANVVNGRDLTLEAAITKLAFVLGRTDDPAEARHLMATNLKGEMDDNDLQLDLLSQTSQAGQ